MKQSHIIADVDVLRCVQEDGSSQDIVNILMNLKSYEIACLCISLANDGKVDKLLCDRFNSVNAASRCINKDLGILLILL
jgi:hypothetical protein